MQYGMQQINVGDVHCWRNSKIEAQVETGRKDEDNIQRERVSAIHLLNFMSQDSTPGRVLLTLLQGMALSCKKLCVEEEVGCY